MVMSYNTFGLKNINGKDIWEWSILNLTGPFQLALPTMIQWVEPKESKAQDFNGPSLDKNNLVGKSKENEG